MTTRGNRLIVPGVGVNEKVSLRIEPGLGRSGLRITPTVSPKVEKA